MAQGDLGHKASPSLRFAPVIWADARHLVIMS